MIDTGFPAQGKQLPAVFRHVFVTDRLGIGREIEMGKSGRDIRSIV